MATTTQTLEVLIQGKDAGALALATTLGDKLDVLGLRGMKAADALAILRDRTAEGASASAAASKAADDLAKATDRKNAAVTSVTSAYRVLTGVLATLGVGAVIKDFLDANIQFERTNLTLKAVTGSTADAAKEMDFIRDVANRLGLEVGSTATQYSQLLAASKGTALEGQATRDIFEKVTTAMAVLGKSSADTGGVLNALTQIISKGTVQAEELKGQIGDRLPGALQIAAKALGVTTGDLQALMKDGLIPASTFLPKFAAELDKAFGTSGPINTYGAQVARLKNELDLLYTTVGQAGVMDALASAVKFVSKETAVFSSELTAVGSTFTGFTRLVKGDVSLDGFIDQTKRAWRESEIQRIGLEALAGEYQTTAESARLLRLQTEAIASINSSNQTDAETQRLIRQNGVLDEAATRARTVDTVLKNLGLDPKKLAGEVNEIVAKFEELVDTPGIDGKQMLAGLKVTLKSLTEDGEVDAVAKILQDAFRAGGIQAGEFALAIDLVNKKSAAVNPALKETAEQFKKTEQAAERAKKAAEDFRLKMEELASNERIKLIEAKVQLDIANVEANAKKAIAAFESINATIASTGTSLTDLFKLFAENSGVSFESLQIRKQIDLENARRQEALDLQKRLIETQIAQIQAQTQALNRGDAIIKIDGAGLQPHLEGFMWEILRTIQTRVNSQGLDLLLGMPGI